MRHPGKATARQIDPICSIGPATIEIMETVQNGGDARSALTKPRHGA
jgi:hypothetical protein